MEPFIYTRGRQGEGGKISEHIPALTHCRMDPLTIPDQGQHNLISEGGAGLRGNIEQHEHEFT